MAEKQRSEFTSFIMACMDFFGKHPGETTMQFGDEIKALTAEDKEQLTEMLKKAGYKSIK